MSGATCRGGADAMWRLVERYTANVGYERPVKAEGLKRRPPVIDCSGWVRVLLAAAMDAENAGAGREVFRAADIAALQSWSDRIVQEIETRTGVILEGRQITPSSLPPMATIGLKEGEPVWARNHPRSRGITHVVQVVRRPDDQAAFVSESQGWAEPFGIRLTPLTDWLASVSPRIDANEIWAVDPFAMARRGTASDQSR